MLRSPKSQSNKISIDNLKLYCKQGNVEALTQALPSQDELLSKDLYACLELLEVACKSTNADVVDTLLNHPNISFYFGRYLIDPSSSPVELLLACTSVDVYNRIKQEAAFVKHADQTMAIIKENALKNGQFQLAKAVQDDIQALDHISKSQRVNQKKL